MKTLAKLALLSLSAFCLGEAYEAVTAEVPQYAAILVNLLGVLPGMAIIERNRYTR